MSGPTQPPGEPTTNHDGKWRPVVTGSDRADTRFLMFALQTAGIGGYPPDLQETAIQLVLSQAERLADDWAS